MAEVATDVLHNVSNTLNSVLVGSEVLVRSIEGMRLDGVAQAAALLEQHAGGLGLYLEEDEQGKHLPAYLKALGRSLVEGREAARREIGRLRENLDAIRCIVISQQAHAGARHIVETFAPREAADEAIDLHAQALERKGVEVTREYAAMPPIVCDRHRLLQILGNLVKNAAEAFPDDAPRPRRLIVRVAPADGERVRIEVEDTGEGIAPEHLERLFSHGFTTRPGGHGFGLHGAANIAQQLGGSLTARSDGRGRGATFLLDLPLRIRGDDAVDRPSPAAASETKAPQIS
jgi:signal transduction histidine kinase